MHPVVLTFVALSAATLSAGVTRDRPTRQDSAVVRAVLFFAPTCPHCHEVISGSLPAIFEAYGGPARVLVNPARTAAGRFAYLLTNARLEVLLIDASVAAGYALYENATAAFAIPTTRTGVPRLIIGDSVLVGSAEIPARLPGLIDRALAAGGLAWPAVPALETALATIPSAKPAPTPVDPERAVSTTEPQRTEAPRAPPREQEPATAGRDGPVPPAAAAARETTLAVIPSASTDRSLRSEFGRDPVGFGLAVIVLAITGASLVAVPIVWRRGLRAVVPGRLFPVLGLLGLVVAIYLAYVEVTGANAVCGPVGDCGAVHASPYARVFGVIPVGVLGVAGYVLLLGLWAAARRDRSGTAGLPARALVGVSYLATAFSAYLTALEPFVIGATCLWCLGSAVIVTALLWLAAAPGGQGRTLAVADAG